MGQLYSTFGRVDRLLDPAFSGPLPNLALLQDLMKGWTPADVDVARTRLRQHVDAEEGQVGWIEFVAVFESVAQVSDGSVVEVSMLEKTGSAAGWQCCARGDPPGRASAAGAESRASSRCRGFNFTEPLPL